MSRNPPNKRQEGDETKYEKLLRKSESQRQSTWQLILVAVGIIACCGLPFLVIAAGSLTIYSLLHSTNIVILMAAIVVLAFVLYGIRIRRKK